MDDLLRPRRSSRAIMGVTFLRLPPVNHRELGEIIVGICRLPPSYTISRSEPLSYRSRHAKLLKHSRNCMWTGLWIYYCNVAVASNDVPCLHKIISWEIWIRDLVRADLSVASLYPVLIFVLTRYTVIHTWVVKSERMFQINFSTDFWRRCRLKVEQYYGVSRTKGLLFTNWRWEIFFLSCPKFSKKVRKRS